MAPVRRTPTLSEDLISEILVRAPLKSILRCQSVCKTWLSLIKHPDFVKSQLLRAITTQIDQTFIINRFSKDFSHSRFSLFHAGSRQIVADLKYQGEFKNVPKSFLVGSANGIVCFVVNDDFMEHKTSTYLWNPAIRQAKVIPPFNIGNNYYGSALGFGYDEIDDDFKVVRVVRFESPPSFCAEVYSNNRNAWKMVHDVIDFPCSFYFDVCVNGILCGIGKHGMMTFDLNKEVLNCAIKLPFIDDDDDDDDDDVIDIDEARARIIEFNNNSVAVAVIILIDELKHVKEDLKFVDKINIWTLNDDACLRGGGVEASWTPVFSIDIGEVAMIVHAYFSERDLLLLAKYDNRDYMWISCDVDKKEVKIVPLSVDMAGHYYSRDAYKYTETLVSLAGFEQVKWDAGEDDN